MKFSIPLLISSLSLLSLGSAQHPVHAALQARAFEEGFHAGLEARSAYPDFGEPFGIERRAVHSVSRQRETMRGEMLITMQRAHV